MKGRAVTGPWVRRAAVLLAWLLVPLAASAGQSCEEAQLGPDTLRKAMAAAQKVTAEMEKRQGNVALLGRMGRMGRDLAGYGLKYCHIGFVYRSANE